MDKGEFLLKLLLLGFECQPKTFGVDTQYRYKHLCIQFYTFRTGITGVRLLLHSGYETVVTALTINQKYEAIYDQILKNLGIEDEHVQGELEEEDYLRFV